MLSPVQDVWPPHLEVTAVRCLGPLLGVVLVAVLGFMGYNYTQINQLRGELAQVKAQVHRTEVSPSDKQDLVTSLTSVREHTARARQMLAKGQTARARAELDKSLNALDNASTISRSIPEGSDGELISKWMTAQKEIEKAWKEISKQIEAQGSGSNKLRNKE